MNEQVATLMSAAVGMAIAGLTLTAQPVAAIQLTFEGEGETPENWTNLNWGVEGRIGGITTWEFTIKEGDIVSQPNHPQFDWVWINEEEAQWSLSWDTSTASFNVGDLPPVSVTPEGLSANLFDGFYLWTRATTTPDRVDPGSNVFFSVDTVNGQTLDPVFSTATAPFEGSQITKNYFSSDTAITSLSGVARMSWPDGAVNPFLNNAQSRLGLKIEGFFTGNTSNPPIPEPEAVSLLGLVAVGTIGSLLKRK